MKTKRSMVRKQRFGTPTSRSYGRRFAERSTAAQKGERMATIVRNGIRLAYDDRGAGEPIIVFVPGWTCDRSFFAPQAEHFSRKHRVVSVDLRGHGESDKPDEPYPIGAYAEDIAYLIDQLGLGKVVAIGNSMGGLAVAQLAASHPGCVTAIVMVEPGPFAPPPDFRAGMEAIADSIEAGNQE